jgi:hypothetical protein
MDSKCMEIGEQGDEKIVTAPERERENAPVELPDPTPAQPVEVPAGR